MKHHYHKRFAFTLAEVLITLAIIGVVAALTIPSLISKHNEKVAIAELNKMYTELTKQKIYKDVKQLVLNIKQHIDRDIETAE